MLIFVNDRGEIHDVNTTTDPKLIPIEVTDGSFDNMSEALICCYKVTVIDGVVIMRTPYVPSTVLESIDRLGRTKTNSTAIASEETIGHPSTQTYEKDDTFMANGLMYRASVKIWAGSILVDNGNCERTTINEELSKIKEAE